MRDLWSLPLASISGGSSSIPTWTQGASFPSGCRWGGTGDLMVAPTGEQYLGMFGGRHLAKGAEEHNKKEKKQKREKRERTKTKKRRKNRKKAAYTYYNDLWLYEFAEDRWFQADSTGEKPPAHDHHGAATLSGQLFVHGGWQSENRKAEAVLADIWSYSMETRSWTQHIPAGKSPSARFMPGVAAVRYHGVETMAVFAGETLPGSTKHTTLNDVWVFDPAEASWTELFPRTCDLIPTDLLGPSSHEEFMTDLSRTGGAIAAAMAIMLVVKFAMASRRSAYALEMPESSFDCQDLTYRLL
ncbi:unnamed protein product [Polarella glacialis]|uniref:Uncharacterized protein n=1 Tax=Polarella glacialis TaxID=89957 RepID=A0A813GK33_POLGL|nr:unnamed protein product [Polarella glacialis]